jgi:LacI family gluconate utilization system Gnt-I transcriptional repressor
MGAGIVPKTDLGLFGFNGLEIGQALPVPLSTIRSDRYRIGRLAVEHILDPRERGDEPRIVDVGFEIVVGGTA